MHSYERKLLRIYVERWGDWNNADPFLSVPTEYGHGDAKVTYAIDATLLYPRSGTQKINVTRYLIHEAAQQNEEIVFDQGQGASGLSKRSPGTRDFLRNGLFKEIVEGETILEIRVLRVSKPSKLAQFARNIFGFSADLINISVPSISSSAPSTVSKLMEEGNSVDILGEADLEIFAKSIKSEMRAQLLVPETIRKTFFVTNDTNQGNEVQRRPIVLKKGENGAIYLAIEAYEPD